MNNKARIMQEEELRQALEEYMEFEDIELPYKTKWGFIITQLNFSCPECERSLEEIKGKIREFSSCIDIRAMGFCYDCKTIVRSSPVRHYRDGRFLQRTEDGWVPMGHSGNSLISCTTIVLFIISLIISAILIFV